jgi:hypothetical protein
MCSEVLGYPVRCINETKLYPSFHFSQITFNLRYEIFDRNVAYFYKTLATKYAKSSVSVVFSFAICKGVQCYFLVVTLSICLLLVNYVVMFPSIGSHFLLNLCSTKIKHIVVCGWNIPRIGKNCSLLFVQHVLIRFTSKQICESQGLCDNE